MYPPNQSPGTKYDLRHSRSEVVAIMQMHINHDIYQSVDQRDMILTCTPTLSTWGSKFDLDLQDQKSRS